MNRRAQRFLLMPLLASLAALSTLAGPLPAGANPPPPFKIGSHFSRGLQKYTGINALTNFTASAIATLVVKHEVGGKVRVKVKTYSFTDLLAGKVRSIDVQVKDGKLNDAPVGDLHVYTATPVWFRYFKDKEGKPGVRIPALVTIDGNISEAELSTALASDEVASKIRMIKLDLPGVGKQQLQLLDPKVDFADGQVKVNTVLLTQGASRDTGVNLTVLGKPLLEGQGRIVLGDMQVSSPDIPNPEQFSEFSSKLLNPLVDFQRMDRRDHAFRMSKLTVGDKELDFSGNLILAPTTPPPHLAQRQAGKK